MIMITNNYYLFQVTMVWGLLYLFYYLFLGKETFFKPNRIYLLGALVVGLVIPFAQAALQDAEVGLQVVRLPMITITNQETPLLEPAVQSHSFDLKYWLLVVYWIGVGVMSLRLLRDFIGLVWMIRGHRKERIDGLTLVHINRDMAPFSFFNYLFVFDIDRFSQEEWGQILLHEKTHIDQLHSLDILFTEVLKIIFWWNPLTYLYQRSLREVHEYEADHTVKKQENMKQYGLLLMKQSLSGNQVAVANSFINSQLKKRIIMMTKKRSNSLAKYKYAWSLPLLLMLIFVSFGNRALAQKIRENVKVVVKDSMIVLDPNTYEETLTVLDGSYYKNETLESPAILTSCKNEATLEQKEKCSQQQLMNMLTQHIKYPKAAFDLGKEGMVVVRIYIQPYTNDHGVGTFVKYEVLDEPGLGMAEEVIRALQETNMKWEAGTVNGKRVESAFVLPVKFKINENTQPLTEDGMKKNAAEKGFKDIKVVWEDTSLDVSFMREKYTTVSIIAYNTMGSIVGASAMTYDEIASKAEPHHVKFELEGIYGQTIFLRFSDADGNVFVKKVVKSN